MPVFSTGRSTEDTSQFPKADYHALLKIRRKHLDKLHRNASNLASDDRQVQREPFLDLGREPFGWRKPIKDFIGHFAEHRSSKQAIVILGS